MWIVSLRERKRARTRQALVDAAVDLFERNGYERTTVADIAAAAEIGTRTFFSYFPTKEDVLFPETDARLRATVAAIDSRSPGEGPAEVLVRALREVTAESTDLTGRTARLRMRLMLSVPALMGRGLQLQLAGQRQIARHLQAAYPAQLDAVSAAALAGALTGAVTGALLALFEDPDRPDDPEALRIAVERATEIALSPWKRTALEGSHE
ncbi:TetR/AcrR family transcriptional regulator [Actinoplanes sp. KI2]|uniref:TetR/AcrR family transcriptional regulator n=1 Tax=Actinoplanes sp. KI2 TaxID=2983315 RepID=UPI0021D5FD8D|nr:TetR/AcrR family transcriptional regulator [Actinoplanes sp. KI2]MCU7729215.1 TetR/AcrR family transcriptional regulator [Actinoplanes sp. KI2]